MMFYEKKIRLCFIGNPNVGKSSLINRLLGANKLKISKNPGTTKEIIETTHTLNKKEFIFIDTAGVYKKRNIDFINLSKAIKSCDIVILILEATIERLDRLNKRLVNYSLNNGKGLIIIFNKWDLITNKKVVKKKLTNIFKFSLTQIISAEIMFVSALKDIKFNKIFELSGKIKDTFNKKIQTSSLNKWLSCVTKLNPPAKIKGKELKLKYVTQIKNYPPTFIIFSNYSTKIDLTYKRFLEKKLKNFFKLGNVPIFIRFNSTKNPYENKKN